jgi:hypothetical protein
MQQQSLLISHPNRNTIRFLSFFLPPALGGFAETAFTYLLANQSWAQVSHNSTTERTNQPSSSQPLKAGAVQQTRVLGPLQATMGNLPIAMAQQPHHHSLDQRHRVATRQNVNEQNRIDETVRGSGRTTEDA